jgi:hypothetical protein
MTGQKPRKPARSKYSRDLEKFIADYIQATGDHAWTTRKIANWLIKTGQWEDQEINAVRYLARQLSGAARSATITDEQGNKVRKYHAYRLGPQQPMLWTEIDHIEREHMDESKTMRRNKLVAGAIQLHLDLRYFNENHNTSDPILFDPNFTRDIEDRSQPSDYDDTPPDAGDDES